jgi:mRNA interferase MazF
MFNWQWKIFWANLDPAKDSEQSGIRPVIIISGEESNLFLPIIAVLPLTSFKVGRKIYPTEFFLLKNDTGLEKDSIAMAHQIRVISKERLLEQCGSIDSDDIKESIKNAIKVYLDL